MKTNLNLGKIYSDICKGYTEVKLAKTNYYKHPSSIDIGCLEQYENQMIEFYKGKGAFGEKELIETKIKSGDWSIDQQNKMDFLSKNIGLMVSKKRKASVLSQLEAIEEIIKDYEKEYRILERIKNSLLNLSAESLALSAKAEYVIALHFFSDSDLKNNSFTLDEVINFYTEELIEVLSVYRNINKEISLDNIRRISIKPYVREAIKSSSGIESFFGKKGYELTLAQIRLFDYSNYFTKLLEKIEDITPEEQEDPDEIERIFILTINKDNEKPSMDRSGMIHKLSKIEEFNKQTS